MLSKNVIKQVKLLEQKKYRTREKMFVAEGPKVVGDLLHCGYRAQALYATEEWEPATGGAPHLLTRVTPEELRRISFLQHPQQVLGVFHLPIQKTSSAPSTGLSLALDGVQDPGNLGTIIRVACWFGIENIYCSPDTADAWNPKVVQATMGSIARVNVIYTDLYELLSHCELPIYGTLLEGHNIYGQELSPNGIIVMGNEGKGISPAIRALVNQQLLIPSFYTGNDGAESLNVAIATAITCAEFRRRTFA